MSKDFKIYMIGFGIIFVVGGFMILFPTFYDALPSPIKGILGGAFAIVFAVGFFYYGFHRWFR
jgi:hypothetical protein